MKITKASHWTEHLELSRPYRIAYETIDNVANHFVRLQTDDGTVGVGVASPAESVTGETITDCRAALIDHLEPLLVGQDIRQLKTLCRELTQVMPTTPAARAAVDMALYDLAAKGLNLPLADLLGRVHRCLPTSITIGILSVEETLAEAREYIARGFRLLKVKIGACLEEDLERLAALRQEVGAEIGIRVDANQGYTPTELDRFMAATAGLEIEIVEQPLDVKQTRAMITFPQAVRDQSAADESLLTPVDAVRFLESPHPFGIFNIKLMKCGGITPALQIAEIAFWGGIDLMWGCMDESVIGIAAALHAAFASPNTRFLDLDGSLDLARDPAHGGFRIKAGMMTLTDTPGLGVELEE